MGTRVCQKVAFFQSIVWNGPVIGVSKMEKCESGETEDQAKNALSYLTRPDSYCTRGLVPEGHAVVKCYPIGNMEIEKPNWLQRAGIAVSDFFSRFF